MENKPHPHKSLVDQATEQKQAFLASMEALRDRMMAMKHERCEGCGEEFPRLKENGRCVECFDRSVEMAKLPKKTEEEEIDEILDIDERYP